MITGDKDRLYYTHELSEQNVSGLPQFTLENNVLICISSEEVRKPYRLATDPIHEVASYRVCKEQVVILAPGVTRCYIGDHGLVGPITIGISSKTSIIDKDVIRILLINCVLDKKMYSISVTDRGRYEFNYRLNYIDRSDEIDLKLSHSLRCSDEARSARK
jgi:hypothetical protein